MAKIGKKEQRKMLQAAELKKHPPGSLTFVQAAIELDKVGLGCSTSQIGRICMDENIVIKKGKRTRNPHREFEARLSIEVAVESGMATHKGLLDMLTKRYDDLPHSWRESLVRELMPGPEPESEPAQIELGPSTAAQLDALRKTDERQQAKIHRLQATIDAVVLYIKKEHPPRRPVGSPSIIDEIRRVIQDRSNNGRTLIGKNP